MSNPTQESSSASEKATKPELIWTNILFFGITFIVAITFVPWLAFTAGISSTAWLWGIGLWLFSSTSISMGYHRLWSHRAYEANPVIRFFLALGGCLALQNSALHWSSDHRIHHRHVDHDHKDPYSASLGFWHSHIGWLLLRRDNGRYDEQYDRCPDLKRDPIVMFQHKYYWKLAVGLNIAVPLALGLVYGNLLEMFLVAGVLRLVWSHHLTFFINSLAHIWGTRPYTEENSARDNVVLAILTGGEGYHNYHHKFQYDYRNGIHWWHFDPSKWWIKSLSWIGLTKNLKVVSEEKIEKAKAETLLLKAKDKLKHSKNAEELLAHLHHEYDQLVERLTQYYAVKREWFEHQKIHVSDVYSEASEAAKERYHTLKLQLATQRKIWKSQISAYN